jgi:hypothetical protein
MWINYKYKQDAIFLSFISPFYSNNWMIIMIDLLLKNDIYVYIINL